MSSIYTPRYTYDYYLRNAYSKYRDARKSDFRATQQNNTLIQADSSAIKNISDKLRNLEYDTDHSDEIIQTTKAFIETYNNLLDSSGSSDSNAIAKLQKQLSNMTKDEKEELEAIGIEIKTNGKLKLDEKTFGECKPSKIAKVFSSDNTFTKSLKTYASKIYKLSSRLVSAYDSNGAKKTDTNQSGSTVDISL